eukprot:jgi/Phyca11/114737/e_gw1.27.439.1
MQGRTLTQVLTRVLQPEVRVSSVHPHPSRGRLVSLWTGVQVWSFARKHFRAWLSAAPRRRGSVSLLRRAAKWKEADAKAADGLSALEWRRIRRIVGIGPWGEQILLRLKLYAFSLYDPITGRSGCPHSTCV